MKNHVVSDVLLAASTADVQRQADELRQLVREAIDLVFFAEHSESGQIDADDWLLRAREAAR